MKPPETAQKVIDACTEYETFWKPRNDRAKIAWEKYHLYDKEEKAKKDDNRAYFISNEPRTLAETVISLISRRDPFPRIPITTETPAQTKVISQIERMLIGVKRMADEKMRQSWRGPNIATLSAKNATLRGWYGACKLIIRDDGSIYIGMFDPIEFYPELGPEGPRRIIHKYVMTVSEALNEWGDFGYRPVEDRISDVTVYDDWWYDDAHTEDNPQVYNDVVIEDNYQGSVSKKKREGAVRFVKEPTLVEDMPCIPIVMGPVTGTTIRDDTLSGVKWQATVGQDVYSLNVSLQEDGADEFAQFNRYMSLILELVDKAANRGLILKSPNMEFTEDMVDDRAGGATPAKSAWAVEAMPYTTAPVEVNNILRELAGEIQRGGIPWALTGQTPFEMSGYALDKLLSAALITLNAFEEGHKSFFKDFWRLFLEQYRRRGKGTVTFFGELRNGEMFEEQFNPEMIDRKYFVEVIHDPALPEDMASRAAIGNQWRQIGIDMFTISDEVLRLQDPDLIEERKLREMAMSMPPIGLRRVENAFLASGELDKAKIVHEYRMLEEAKLDMQFEALYVRTQQQLAAVTGGGTQLPPGVLPPEAQGTPEPPVPPVTSRPEQPAI